MSRVTPRLPGFSVSLLLVKAEPAYSSTPFLRGCLLASRPPEGCGERPINGLHVSNNQCPPAGGERSVVINGGYSLGIACRIDPSLQAIRSEERRVGKECRCRWSPCCYKKDWVDMCVGEGVAREGVVG